VPRSTGGWVVFKYNDYIEEYPQRLTRHPSPLVANSAEIQSDRHPQQLDHGFESSFQGFGFYSDSIFLADLRNILGISLVSYKQQLYIT
jgi:hypothetical protein